MRKVKGVITGSHRYYYQLNRHPAIPLTGGSKSMAR